MLLFGGSLFNPRIANRFTICPQETPVLSPWKGISGRQSWEATRRKQRTSSTSGQWGKSPRERVPKVQRFEVLSPVSWQKPCHAPPFHDEWNKDASPKVKVRGEKKRWLSFLTRVAWIPAFVGSLAYNFGDGGGAGLQEASLCWVISMPAVCTVTYTELYGEFILGPRCKSMLMF